VLSVPEGGYTGSRLSRLSRTGCAVVVATLLAAATPARAYVVLTAGDRVAAWTPVPSTGLAVRFCHRGVSFGTDLTAMDAAEAIFDPATAPPGMDCTDLPDQGDIDFLYKDTLGDFAVNKPFPYCPDGTPTGDGTFFAGHLWGWLIFQEPGTITIQVGSDDGFRLYLAGRVAMQTPQPRPFRRTRVVVQATADGFYRFDLYYYENLDKANLELSYAEGDLGDAYDTTQALPAGVASLMPAERFAPPQTFPDGGEETGPADVAADVAGEIADDAAPDVADAAEAIPDAAEAVPDAAEAVPDAAETVADDIEPDVAEPAP